LSGAGPGGSREAEAIGRSGEKRSGGVQELSMSVEPSQGPMQALEAVRDVLVVDGDMRTRDAF